MFDIGAANRALESAAAVELLATVEMSGVNDAVSRVLGWEGEATGRVGPLSGRVYLA